jgi:hypothetical protein
MRLAGSNKEGNVIWIGGVVHTASESQTIARRKRRG